MEWVWYLTLLSTIFQLYRGGQFYWWMKPEYLEKTDNLNIPKVCVKHQSVNQSNSSSHTLRGKYHWKA
jgi:hypothetical protein